MVVYGEKLPEGLVLPEIEGAGNDYSFLEKMLDDNFQPLPISIVIPVYNRIDMLRRTIAMLTHQSYPLHLLEIIIADDGSDDNPEQLIEEFKEFFDINYVRQKDEGYRLSHVRNLGVRSARYENIIILDCDMAPVPKLVETYAKWLVLDYNVILIGHRRYVDANQIDPVDVLDNPSQMLELPPVSTKNKVMANSPTKDWREPIYEETQMLLNSPHPFRTSSCGNVAFNKRIFEHAGNFDEHFTAWGAEDNEFGYRVWNAGYYFIPLLEALGLHQEPPGGREFVDREAGKLITRPMLLDKVPIYRDYNPEIVSTTPSITIFIVTKNDKNTIKDTINSIFSQSYQDFKLIICDTGSTDGTLGIIRNMCNKNPRVSIIKAKFETTADVFNFCISKATGMYIMQINSNEQLERQALEKLFDRIEDDPSVSCVFGTNNSIKEIQKQDNETFDRKSMLKNMAISKPRLFRKRDWSRVNGFSNNYYQEAIDYDFYQKLSEVGIIKKCQNLLKNPTITEIKPGPLDEFVLEQNKLVVNSALDRLGLSNFKSNVTNSRSSKLILEQVLVSSSDPFISIVIITKNRSNLIEDSIISCLNQTYNKFELVIIDDGSTDDTELIINKFKDSRIKYFKKESSGIPKSRNYGVKKATGEYIVIMDDDDLMLPNRIREHVDALTPEHVGSHGGWIDQNSDYEHEYYPGAPHGYSQILFGGKVMLHPASMIKRSILLEFPYDEKYSFGTDYVMNLEIARAGHRLNHTGTYILLRRFHGGNVTLTNSGEQQSTAKVRVREFLEELDEETERVMRKEWKNTDYCVESHEPTFEELESYFPWINITNDPKNQIKEDSILKNKPLDDYLVNERWLQTGNLLTFDALTRNVYFEMPIGWRMEATHSDLFRLAHYVLLSPWEEGILDGWVPTRTKGWRTSLAFSGGVDSTACMLIMPEDTLLCYHERSGFKSQLKHANAHHFIKQLNDECHPVISIKSNHELIRTDRDKGPGFSTDLAATVQNILLADYLEIGSIAMGMPLENAYLFHGHTGRDFAKTHFWKHNSKLMQNAGIDLLYPTAGVSEVINHKIVEKSKYKHLAESCLRSDKQGMVCGKCWKCFRKNSMKGKMINIVGEISAYLEKRPLKQAISTLYAIKLLPKSQIKEITNLHPDLREKLDQDYSILEKYLPNALELLPDEHKEIVKLKLDEIAEAMSEEEVLKLMNIDLSK